MSISTLKKFSPSPQQIVDILSAVKFISILNNSSGGMLTEPLFQGDLTEFMRRLQLSADDFFTKGSAQKTQLFSTIAIVFSTKLAVKLLQEVLRG